MSTACTVSSGRSGFWRIGRMPIQATPPCRAKVSVSVWMVSMRSGRNSCGVHATSGKQPVQVPVMGRCMFTVDPQPCMVAADRDEIVAQGVTPALVRCAVAVPPARFDALGPGDQLHRSVAPGASIDQFQQLRRGQQPQWPFSGRTAGLGGTWFADVLRTLRPMVCPGGHRIYGVPPEPGTLARRPRR